MRTEDVRLLEKARVQTNVELRILLLPVDLYACACFVETNLLLVCLQQMRGLGTPVAMMRELGLVL